MTERTSPKQATLQLVKELEDDTSYEEIIHELYVLKRIEEGLQDVDEGRTKTHEEVRQEVEKWLE